jgi:hypothetical protein
MIGMGSHSAPVAPRPQRATTKPICSVSKSFQPGRGPQTFKSVQHARCSGFKSFRPSRGLRPYPATTKPMARFSSHSSPVAALRLLSATTGLVISCLAVSSAPPQTFLGEYELLCSISCHLYRLAARPLPLDRHPAIPIAYQRSPDYPLCR